MFILFTILVPVMLFIFSLGLRVALVTALVKIRTLKSKLEQGLTDKTGGSYYAVLAMLKSLTLLVYTLKLFMFLVRGVITIFTFLGIKLALITGVVVILTYAIISFVALDDFDGTVTDLRRDTRGVYRSLDYNSIDWFSDFSGELGRISSDTERNWAEFAVLTMRTLNGESTGESLEYMKLAPYYFLGFKSMESGSAFFGDPAGKRITHNFSDRDPISTYGGPLQTSAGGGWTTINSSYDPIDSVVSGGELRDSGYGSRQFMPDITLGVLSRFNSYIDIAINDKSGSSRRFKESKDDILEMFDYMGIEATEEKLTQAYVMFLANSYNHGSIADFDERPSYKGLTALYIQFLDLYVWGSSSSDLASQPLLDLALSVNKEKSDSSYGKLYPLRKNSWVQGSRVANSPAPYSFENDSGNYGIVDNRGNAVDGSLYKYLLGEMSTDKRQEVLGWLQGSGINIDHDKTATRDQFIFGFVALIDGMYSMEMIAETLGVTKTQGSGGYVPLEHPIPNYYHISSPYGYRFHPKKEGRVIKFHRGVDFPGTMGTSIVSAEDGEVVYSGVAGSYGNYILIKHSSAGDNLYTAYAHLMKRFVSTGDEVSRGEEIGLNGSTGSSTGPHLHFEVINAEHGSESSNGRVFSESDYDFYVDPVYHLRDIITRGTNPRFSPDLDTYDPWNKGNVPWWLN